MNRSFIRKTKKKKQISTCPSKNPEQIARMHLIEISNQANLSGHTQYSENPQLFLDIESHHYSNAAEAKSKQTPKSSLKKYQKPLYSEYNYDSITKAFDILVKHKANVCSFFNEPLRNVKDNQVIIYRKNPINITNFVVIDNPHKQKNRLLSAQNIFQKNKYPSSIRNLLRRKSANHGFKSSTTVQTERQFSKSFNSSRVNFSSTLK